VLEAQVNAWGEGMGDSDHSKIHLYFTYEFTPEESGVLHLHVGGGHLAGERSWWANDAWYNSEEAEFAVDATLDVHQGLWKKDQSKRVFGGETTDVGSGRIAPFYERVDLAPRRSRRRRRDRDSEGRDDAVRAGQSRWNPLHRRLHGQEGRGWPPRPAHRLVRRLTVGRSEGTPPFDRVARGASRVPALRHPL
jgi:hypothetical protein